MEKTQMGFIVISESKTTNTPLIIDFLKGFIGNHIQVSYENQYTTVLYENFDRNVLSEGLSSLWEDISDFKVFISKTYYKKTLIERDILSVKKLLDCTDFQYGLFDESKLCLEAINTNNKQELKSLVLGIYSNDSQVLEMIRVFLECNMNTSLAAKKLYMHRNTLINRLDKFKLVTGYDLKDFKDAYLIYSLL